MARKSAPAFEFLINGIGLFEVENVVDANLLGPIVTVQDAGGVNAYPSSRCVLIANPDGSMQAFIPGSGHVADFTLDGNSLSVAPGALGVLLANGDGWAFIGGALNFEGVTTTEFTVDGLDDSAVESDDTEEEEEAEEEEEPEPQPARGRGRPPKNAEPAEEPRRGRGRPPGSKNKPKEEPAPAPRGRPAPQRSGFRR